MKTLIELPDGLIEEAMRMSKQNTKVATIKKALQDMINREKRKQLLQFKGKVDLDIDLDKLRDRKEIEL